MRFIIFPRTQPDSFHAKGDEPSCDPERGEFSEELFAAYMKYNEDMVKAGVLLASEGLNPQAKPAQVGTSGGKRRVIDGPFAESKELVGGFYLIDVKSRDEAIEWALRCPVGLGHDVLEIRQLTAMEDLPPRLQELMRSSAPKYAEMWSR